MDRYICIHGHFYQPPRENPWLEAVEVQDSAHPYHDWNERVTSECYAPNSASRVLDGDDRVIDIVSNYAGISFNFGPTLLSWMESNAPDVYRSIIRADGESMVKRSGHGNAIAQVYNHMIMPLASGRDKRTQVLWGIRDFESRFGRSPEGMWLAETAVDMESLDILAEAGISFTILAPHQAGRVRKIGEKRWRDVDGESIDPTRAYLCRLPSGRDINLFFYDGPISRAVAFENLLNRGEEFAHRLLDGFSEEREWPQLLHIATDGETYGHHHKFGDMALAYALNYIEENGLARITNYGEYLEMHPPTHEVRIVEKTSWSCFHGTKRWRSDCGCNSGGNPGWNQEWRAPLRTAMDMLRDRLSEGYARKLGEYLRDPWLARDDYISVVLDRSIDNIGRFMERHGIRRILPEEWPVVLELLEMQRHAMLMYTSCGWFFDEISGVETVQVIQYAGRAIQLAEKLLPGDFTGPFMECLSAARSNIPEHENGGRIFEKFVKPCLIDLVNVGAHYAVSSIFEEYKEETGIYCYRIDREEFRTLRSGDSVLAVGRIGIHSTVTHESGDVSFCVVNLGNHAVHGGGRSFLGKEVYETMKDEMMTSFAEGDQAEIIHLMDRHFGMHNYALRDLFRDEQRKVLGLILTRTLTDFDGMNLGLYEKSRGLMTLLKENGIPIPASFLTTAGIALNLELRNALAMESADTMKAGMVLAEMRNWKIRPESVDLEFLLRRKIERMMEGFRKDPGDGRLLTDLLGIMEFVAEIPMEINFWKAQNIWFEMAKSEYPRLLSGPGADEPAGLKRLEDFEKLGEQLGFNVRAVVPES
jgi:alpha-amylase/alpha-mannosidase (GH57 family)